MLLAGSLLFLLLEQVVMATSDWSFVSVMQVGVFVPSALVLLALARVRSAAGYSHAS